jgi:hypothetical protein
MRFVLLLILVSLLLCSIAYSAPSISSIDKSLTASSNNVSFVLSGSDFGTKSTANPLKWDNFETGSDGNSISTGGYWGVYGTCSYEADNQRSANSSINCKALMNSTSFVYKDSIGFGTTDAKILISAWLKYDEGTGDDDYQIKMFRIGNLMNSGTNNLYPSIANFTYVGSDRNYYQLTTELVSTATSYQSPQYTDGQWSNIMVEIETSSGKNVADGILKHYKNFVLKGNKTTWSMFDGDRRFAGVRFGEGTYNGSNNDQIILWDDIYIDNTWSRIELGNTSVYSNCSHREIQIPTAWSADSITFTCNQGTFTETDNIYAFVVDSDGTASTGLLVSGASGGGDVADTTPPSIAGQNPSDNANNVAINSAIVFVASDGASGVDLNSLTLSNAVSVNNVNYASSLSASGDKNSVTCTLSNAVLGNFEPAETVTVGVNIKDLSENSVLTTWDFTTEDNTFRQNAQTLTLNGQTLELK